jgi:low temperature requirement protein LtrA
LIIAAGETVLTTGTVIIVAKMTVMTVVTGTAALAASVALWALYFGGSSALAIQSVETTSDSIRGNGFRS